MPTAWLLLLLAGVGLAFAAGRRCGRTHLGRTALPLTVAGVVLFTALVVPRALSGAAAAPPLGYGNANGALLVLAAGAAGMAATVSTTSRLRNQCLLLAVIATACCLLTRSVAATVVCVPV